MGRPDLALVLLAAASFAGEPPFPRAERELAEIRGRLAEIRRPLDEKPPDLSTSDGIGRKIAAMAEADQHVRTLVMKYLSGEHDLGGDEEKHYRVELNKLFDETDVRNTAGLKAILAARGGRWLTPAEFGKDTAHLAWLLVQHADRDPEFQREILETMRSPGSGADPKDVAYLDDRVAVKLGRTQRYGTQVECAGAEPRLQNHAGTDLKAVDRNRKKAGLPPLSAYMRQFAAYCRQPGAK